MHELAAKRRVGVIEWEPSPLPFDDASGSWAPPTGYSERWGRRIMNQLGTPITSA